MRRAADAAAMECLRGQLRQTMLLLRLLRCNAKLYACGTGLIACTLCALL